MSFMRKGLMVSGGRAVAVFLTVVVGILYARVLGPDDVGQWRLWQTSAVILTTLAAMGIPNANIYFVNNRKIPLEIIATNAVKFALVFGLILAVVAGALLIGLPGYFGVVPMWAALVFALGIGMLLGGLLLKQLLIAQLQARRMVLVSLARAGTILVGGFVLAATGALTISTALAVAASSFAVSLILPAAFLRKHIDLSLPFDWALHRQVIAYGFRLAAASILYLISLEVSVVLLRYLMPGQFEPIGLYTRATTLSGLAVMIPRFMGPLLFSKWAGVTGEQRSRQVEMAFRLTITYGLVTVVPLVLAGKYLICLMYGKEFIGAQGALVFLAPATVCVAIFLVCMNLLGGDGRAAVTAWISAATVTLMVVVMFLLVPPLGIRGAAIGTLCGNAFSAVAGLAVCTRLFHLKLRRCFLLRGSDLQYMRRSLLKR